MGCKICNIEYENLPIFYLLCDIWNFPKQQWLHPEKRCQVSFKRINQFKKYGIFLHFLPKMIFPKMVNYGCFWPAVLSLKHARNYGWPAPPL